MSIDIVGLRGFRRDVRKSGDPDETEGRMIYRARAEAEGRMSIALTRKVSLISPAEIDRLSERGRL